MNRAADFVWMRFPNTVTVLFRAMLRAIDHVTAVVKPSAEISGSSMDSRTTNSASPSPPAGCTCSVWSSTWQPVSTTSSATSSDDPPSHGVSPRATTCNSIQAIPPTTSSAITRQCAPLPTKRSANSTSTYSHHLARRHRVLSMGDPPHDRRDGTPCWARRPHTRTHRQHDRLSAQQPPILIDAAAPKAHATIAVVAPVSGMTPERVSGVSRFARPAR
jgi:hypothetical protein